MRTRHLSSVKFGPFSTKKALISVKAFPTFPMKFHFLPIHYQLFPNSYRRISSLPTTITPTDLNNLLNIVSQTTRKTINHAGQIHGQVVVNGYLSFPFLLNSLLKLYAQCGHIAKSISLFSKIPDGRKTIISWTTLITQLSRHAMSFEALGFFEKMRGSGLYPNHFTFSAILPACATTSDPLIGTQIHGLVSKHGFEDDVYVGSALIDMYAKCFDMLSAEKVFDELSERNLVSWNSMIVGYLENRLYDDAILCFKGVLREVSLSPDDVSCSSVFNACANIGGGRLATGMQIHGLVIKRGLVGMAYVKNTLMDMYSKCGSVGDAIKLFTLISDRDVVTWNVMIMGFVQRGDFEKACDFFWMMRKNGVYPDDVSFSTALHACSNIAALNQGVLIHNQVIKIGVMTNVCISSALVTMYGKCGSLVDAQRVFEEIVNRNVICWTAMIAAFQQHGCANQVIQLFERMLQEGIKPEYIAFVCLLSACGHTGKVEEGYSYFNSMTALHGVEPGPEHYSCMVDLLGRAGRLEEAMKFIESMPMKPGPSVWGALLAASRNHNSLEMGRVAAEKLFELEPSNSGNYVMLANMYARDGKMKEADEIRRLMGINGVRKEPGCSWIDMKNSTFVFTANDRSHPRTDEIYEMLVKLKELATKKGYMPDTQFAVNDAEEYKEQSLWYHSEKLALAFGLLALPAKAPIRIKKNLRTCGDCHTVMKFASEIFDREIIVRDINRFHHFANGSCSCGDYW